MNAFASKRTNIGEKNFVLKARRAEIIIEKIRIKNLNSERVIQNK